MWKSIYLSFILVMLALHLGAQEKRLALVIGNGDYEHATTLLNPSNDAQAMAETLELLGFKVQKSINCTQKEMKKAIDYFGEYLKKYDVGLFFFAGHGVQVNGYNYLIPVDARIASEGDVEYDCINAGRMLTKMEASGAATNIVIMDACRNNPFEVSWTRSLSNQGLAYMEAPTGSLIAYSTSPGNTASDGSGKNSLYTESLLAHIGDPELNILQIFQQTRKRVRELSNDQQIPWESTSLIDDFYFNQKESGIITRVSGQTKPAPKRKTAAARSTSYIVQELSENGDITWAEGAGESLFDADKTAKEKLNNKVRNMFADKLSSKYTEKYSISPLVIEQFLNQHIAELQAFIARRTYQTGDTHHILRYIPDAELDKFLRIKEQRIHAFWENGNESEEMNKIGDALKYYYWAYVLTLAHPLQENITVGHTGSNAAVVIDRKIKKLLSGISYGITDSSMTTDGMKRFFIVFEYNQKPLQSIDFRYWNGVAWSEINCINNGVGMIDVYPEYNISDIKIDIEYKYLNKAKFDKTLHQFVKILDYNRFNTLCESSTAPPAASLQAVETDPDFRPENPEAFRDIVDKLVERVSNRDKSYDPGFFTMEGYETYKKLLLYANASFFPGAVDYSVMEFNGEKYIRGLPVKFNARNNNVDFVEKLSIRLDPNNRINGISFTLSDAAAIDIMKKTRWPDESKWLIINFLESYKTAYALERYDYIDKIFSENALIIVGQRVQEAELQDATRYSLSGEKYKLTRLTKEQYMYRLRRVFDKNEFINIQFEHNIVKKRDTASDIYGINIKQNYFSSTYADQGYLFLMVDMANYENPVIHVRAWQPDKFEDGHVIGLSDFTY